MYDDDVNTATAHCITVGPMPISHV